MRFIFFTKTEWAEVPRLRHQMARLLADAGHEIIFFERPYYPWQRITPNESGHPKIHLYRYHQSLHHKLRLHGILHHANAAFEKRQIGYITSLIEINCSDVIVNFNYEYFFLRDLFPVNKIITIINDDFWSRAIAGYERPLKIALAKTCKDSDVVLTVSPSLVNQLKSFCEPRLYFPWADSPYVPPSAQGKRNKLLYWGYIGKRIDFVYLMNLAGFFDQFSIDLEFLFVGPILKDQVPLKSLKRYPKIEFQSPSPLNRLPLDTVLAGFMPYRTDISSINAATLPNKSLQLLARGFPLLITGMPDFIQQPFVFRLGNGMENDLAALRELQNSFLDLQPAIKVFVQANSAEQRLLTFLDYIQ